MIKELLQQKQEISLRGEEEKKVIKKRQQFCSVMDHPELSLGPSGLIGIEITNSSSFESEANPSRKRKHCWGNFKSTEAMNNQTTIELQLKDPLPSDWEQCLDLDSGRMYYLNRNTLKKSWNWPEDQKLDLELNISTLSSSDGKGISKMLEDSKKQSSSSSNMVAVACLKCHLLVMLCKLSPSCPNCKYVHSLPTQQSPLPKTVKSLNTLSLLN